MKNELKRLVALNGVETVLAAMAEMLRAESMELYNDAPEHANVAKIDEVAELIEEATAKYHAIEAV